LCYTEHGQHALFYTKLYNNFPEDQRYTTWQRQKVCVIQKEYPTATNLGKPQRQHWDVVVLSVPPTNNYNGAEGYDYLKLLAGIEFGMNEAQAHLEDDIERLGHEKSNVIKGFIVHLYRLSDARQKFSGRDWSQNSKRIISPDQLAELTKMTSVEIYYGMADSTGKYESVVSHIKDGKMIEIK
jgi:hypothetical protein